MGNFAGLGLQLSKISDDEIENFNFSEKLTQIKNMLSGDNIPNGDRFSELLSACFANKAQGTYLREIIAAMLDSCRAEEELALESSPETRQAILLAEAM